MEFRSDGVLECWSNGLVLLTGDCLLALFGFFKSVGNITYKP
jgi:hypothetical protein